MSECSVTCSGNAALTQALQKAGIAVNANPSSLTSRANVLTVGGDHETFVSNGSPIQQLLQADAPALPTQVAAAQAPAVAPAAPVDPRITNVTLPFRQNAAAIAGKFAQEVANTALQGLPPERTTESVPTPQSRLIGTIPDGANPTIVAAAQVASKDLPPGYRVVITSATRAPGQSHVDPPHCICKTMARDIASQSTSLLSILTAMSFSISDRRKISRHIESSCKM